MSLHLLDGFEALVWMALGVLASYTDLRWGKVYNKHLLLFLVVGAGQLSMRLYMNDSHLGIWSLTLGIGAALAVFLYAVQIWAAGDAKLYVTLLFLIPPPWTGWITSGVPGFSIAITVFSLGYVYLLMETVFLVGKKWVDSRTIKTSEKVGWNKTAFMKALLRFYLSYSLSSLVQSILSYIIPWVYISYREGFILLQVFFLIGIMNRTNSWKNRYLFIVATMCLTASQMFAFNHAGMISLTPLLIVVMVAAVRLVGQHYNYRQIPIEDLRTGMVLSFDAVMAFYGSKVKGLPSSTTESTRSRLREEEVQSILRWSQTKQGSNQIRIVRHMPFAPFIVLGMLMQVLLGFTKII